MLDILLIPFPDEGPKEQGDIECKYCNELMAYSPLEQMERHGIKVFFCHPCQYEETYWANGNLATKSLYTTINNHLYKWTMWGSFCQLYIINKPGIPGQSANDDSKQIKAFHNNLAPKISPSNIKAKLSTILMFL